VWGPRGRRRPLRLVLDTGAHETILTPDVLDEIGYNPRHGEALTVTRSVVGKEHGYLIKVARFRALGFELADFRINALDLPEEYPIHGLLGLGFLRHFNYEIRSREGLIRAERV
jgi:predicted aspartyl protease